MTYKAGIVGCGRIGSEFDVCHASAYRKATGVDIVALSDLDPAKLALAGSKWGIAHLYTDFREMLKAADLDIVSIATGASTHLAITGQAVKSNVKAIYCEKPIAHTLKDADEMIRLCHESGVILQVNHQRRFDGFYQGLNKFLHHGGLGNLSHVRFDYTRGIANTGSHMFDLLRFLLGDVTWVEANYSIHKSHMADDPNIDGSVEFPSGVTGHLQAGPDQTKSLFEMELNGDVGSLAIRNNGSVIDYQPKNGVGQNVVPFQWDAKYSSMVAAVENLVICLEKDEESISSGKDARASLELICAFHESAESGGKRINLPLGNKSRVINSS